MKIKLLVIISLLLLSVNLPAQQPCTNEQAYHSPGKWSKSRFGDDLAMTDKTFPKTQYPVILRKADEVIALVKKALPNLSGVEAQPYRSIRGNPYIKNGPVPFGVDVPIFDYGCVQMTSGDPNLRGKIELNGETGTWIYFYFNSLGWLTNDWLVRGHTANGARIFEMPKVGGNIKGFTLLLPELNVGINDQAIIITPDGNLPYKPLSREKFLLGEQKHYQDELDKLLKMSSVPQSGVAQRQKELAAINNLLNSLSPEEKEAQAIVNYRYGFSWDSNRQKVFVTEAEGGTRLATIDAALFKPGESRAAVKIITVYWKSHDANPAQAETIRQFKNNFDFQALKQMLDQ